MPRRGRCRSAGPHAARDLADLVERIGSGLAPVAVGPALEPARRRAPSCRLEAHAGMMKALGTDIGTIHFVGIGGIGMSGIAEVMHQLGYKVQGSDVADGYVVEKLRKAGIPVSIGHSPDNLGDAAVVVCSTAIKDDNPEVQAAAERRLPRVRRAEMLAELMRMQKTVAVAGTHGKTTTTSMVAALLDSGGIDPTVINGGIINRYGSNARLGKSDWRVVEADESDGSFLRLDGTIAVVTNIDPEHLDHYGSFDAGQGRVRRVRRERALLRRSPCCASTIPRCRRSSAALRDRRIVTYGFSALADVRGDNVTPVPGGNRFDALILDRDGERRTIAVHRCRSRAATMSRTRWPRSPSALELGISDEAILAGFDKFEGVKRRFTKVGEVDGAIDHRRLRPPSDRDPRRARRRRAKAPKGRVIAVVQPHRYTRLQR